MKRVYLLKKRGRFWYYRLADEKTFHSNGQTSKTAALNCAQAALTPPAHDKAPWLRDYAGSFYIWGECDWIDRQHAKERRYQPRGAE